MASNRIYITENDLDRLRALVQSAKESMRNDQFLKSLEGELDRAEVVKPQEVPSDVITMNSEVSLMDMDTEEEMVYRLVFPDQADVDKGYVSILAPVGTALLGYRVGDIIEWKVPAGVAKWKVMKIAYQPEAAGDYNL
ncbi:MAG: nucleoside diphosphate kinase regulator [Chitinispirillaceae bacterium]